MVMSREKNGRYVLAHAIHLGLNGHSGEAVHTAFDRLKLCLNGSETIKRSQPGCGAAYV
jgi:hypothetical protein